MRQSIFNTLSGRILGLMAIFVLVAEVLIFVPSVARFRVEHLQSRLELAQLGALALLAAPDAIVGPDLERELLATAGVYNVVLRREDVRELVLSSDTIPSVAAVYDLRTASNLALMRDAMAVFFGPADRTITVIGQTEQGARSPIEITMAEEPLREAPLVTNDRVYQMVPGRGLVAIDKMEGQIYRQPLWTAPGITRVLTADDRFVYAVQGRDRIVALGRDDGQPKFSVAGKFDFFTAGQDGTIYAATNAGAIVSFKRGPYLGETATAAR
ncbi:MAG TPA: hypothetical protein VK022_03520 [Paracoccaceae bacterium]|nr:hypothetical protein [Paracoccaceae bacterium]